MVAILLWWQHDGWVVDSEGKHCFVSFHPSPTPYPAMQCKSSSTTPYQHQPWLLTSICQGCLYYRLLPGTSKAWVSSTDFPHGKVGALWAIISIKQGWKSINCISLDVLNLHVSKRIVLKQKGYDSHSNVSLSNFGFTRGVTLWFAHWLASNSNVTSGADPLRRLFLSFIPLP